MFRRKKKIDAQPLGEFDPLDKFTVSSKESDTEMSYVDMSFEDFEILEMRGAPKPPEEDPFEDKIFGNSYNQGDVQMSRLPEIRVRSEFAARLDCYNPDTAHIRQSLAQRCEEAFAASQWAYIRDDDNDDPAKEKKFPKSMVPYVFGDLYTALDDGYTSATDRFIAIAEMLKISYEKVYQALPAKIKVRLLSELDSETGSIVGHRIPRLF